MEKQPVKPAMPVFPEGGMFGWMAVVGSWLAIFCSFGMANTNGVFQAYYQFTGYPTQSASNISWVPSVQLFFQFSIGAVAGPLFDKGIFYPLTIGGSILYIVCFFMVSLCRQFWQVVLAQAIGMGIGIGLLFLPSISILSQYFFRRRSLAIGIAVTGSSIGGICLPIMLNNLIASHGFEKAVQYTGYLLLGCLIIACALMHPRFPPRNPNPPPKPSPAQLFRDPTYSLVCAGLFCVVWGLFFPIFYLQVFAQEHGLSENLVLYTLAILNAASVFGRITPNFLADRFGPINLQTIMCYCAGILCFCVFGATSPGGLIAVAILFGFFSGGYVSLIGPVLISLAKNPSEIGMRIGFGFLVSSFAALTGTPITGALLDRFGFYAPIIWSGVFVLVGSVFFTLAGLRQRKAKGTWRI